MSAAAGLRVVLAALVVVCSTCRPAAAQESRFASDLRREREHIAENCGEFSAGKLVSCAVTLATDYPFHVALGSLAPQNGFGFGVAFVERFTPNERWRLGWNADMAGALSGSWRGGAYMKIIHTPDRPIGVVTGGTSSGPSAPAIREYPVFNIYLQGISLKTVSFYGIGPAATADGRSIFAERQTIVGANVIYPIPLPAAIRGLRPSFIGAVNGRFFTVGGASDPSAPSIDQLYDDSTAPGLAEQPTFRQFEEGLRFKPSTPGGRLRLNYLVDFQQFLAASDARASFRRWTIDLGHEIPLYRLVGSSGPRDTNGPDECFVAVGTDTCPTVSYSRNREGTVRFRVVATSSTPLSDGRVPFYLQPTLGGSDVNGQRLVGSLDDYRFRAPHLIALQESVEHGIWGPLGAYFLAEQGKVTDARRDLSLRDLAHSFTVGLTLRAGGMPMMSFSFAWGTEGQHVIGTMDSSLLGGSTRPSLF